MGVFKHLSHLPEFDEELGKLGKRFRTIREDLEIFVDKQLYLYHKLYFKGDKETEDRRRI